MHFAHISDDGRKQTVKEHLENVSEMAEEFSVELLKPFAAAAGMAHDVGKYSQAFQNRLMGKNVRFEHSACGAIEYKKIAESIGKNDYRQIAVPLLEYCIAGHHTGLPDGSNGADDTSLHSRLNREGQYSGSGDYGAYKSEVSLELPDVTGLISELNGKKCDVIELYAFFTRYVFSCLTDADFLDTERFCSPQTARSLSADFHKISEILERRFGEFSADTPLKMARGRLQAQAYKFAEISSGISVLNMPTGSGKTLCSLKIALQKLLAENSGKKRIIYVIPYTSIIEQTAEQFEKMFGECADILQHHSNYCFDDAKDEPLTSQKLKKATENWDAPLIITTSVQFFQSFYHYKGSGLRKLHNIADSVIVFDEIHLLPINMLQPCLRAIGYITKYLNSEVIMLSATMPDYTKLMQKYIPSCEPIQLIRDKEDFKYFQKCQYISLGRTDFDSVIAKAQEYTSSLIIVNTRKACREVFGRVQGKKYHLSTYMTPFDRSQTIKEIRRCLENGERVTVVSTSLIEAGVDFDFEAVFRQLAGLDSILQSGGRCNREGKRERGDVYVFETEDRVARDMQLPVEVTRGVISEFDDITSAECIETYYRRLFANNADIIEMNTISKGVTSILDIPFRTYAKGFEFIEQETVGIVIMCCEEAEKLYEMLKYGDFSVKRRLQKYTVSLKAHGEFDKALSLGIIDDFGTGVYTLTDMHYYSRETGLNLEMFHDAII